MARLPIETGSNTARNLSYFLFNLGDTRDKGLNALTNGLSGLGNTISAYHQQQRDFREKQQEKQRLESLELQKMQQQEAARLSDEAYRNAELGLRKEALEFEKYKYNNPIQKGELDLTPIAYGWENQNTQNAQNSQNQNTQNAQNLQNQNTQNTQMPQMPKEQAEAIKPSTLRSAELSQFFKESDTNNTPAQNYTNQNYNQGYNQNGTNQVPKYTRVITGLPYFDNKPYLTGADFDQAKKWGIDLLEERKDIELKTTNVGKSIEAMNEDISALRNAFHLAIEAQDHAGAWNGLARWFHNKTGGLTPLSNELSNYNSIDQSFTKSIARAEAGGRATNQEQKDAKETYSTRFKSPAEQLHSINGGVEILMRNFEKNMENAHQKSRKIPQETENMYIMLRDFKDYLKRSEIAENFNKRRAINMFNYIENSQNGNRFNYDEWVKIRGKQN